MGGLRFGKYTFLVESRCVFALWKLSRINETRVACASFCPQYPSMSRAFLMEVFASGLRYSEANSLLNMMSAAEKTKCLLGEGYQVSLVSSE